MRSLLNNNYKQTEITFAGKDISIPNPPGKPTQGKRKFGKDLSNLTLKPFEKQALIKEIAKLEEKTAAREAPRIIESRIKISDFFIKRNIEIVQERDNPQVVSEYKDDIFSYGIGIENEEAINPRYMAGTQGDINEKMRSVLIDWGTEVHLKFKFLPDTGFITINIIDRFGSKTRITRDKLQLVGITALMIAGKYEEIYPPEMKAYAYITDNSYSKEEIMKMEYQILATLDFNITIPSALRYAELIQLNMGYGETQKSKINFLIELSMMDYSMMKYSYFTKAIACAIASDGGNQSRILSVCGVAYEKVGDCVDDIMKIVKCIKDGVYLYKGIRKKYSMPEFCEVAKMEGW